MILSRVIPSSTIATARLPQAAAMRLWLESGAGIADEPEKQTPNASAIDIMVAAVPIVIQVP